MTCWLKGSIGTVFYNWLYAPHTCTWLYCYWPCLEEGSFQSCTTHRHGVSQVFNFLKGALFRARISLICNRQASLHFRKCLIYILSVFYVLKSVEISAFLNLPEPLVLLSVHSATHMPSLQWLLGWREKKEDDRRMMWTHKPEIFSRHCSGAGVRLLLNGFAALFCAPAALHM